MTLIHEGLLYGDSDEYLAGTVDFLRGGFDDDEPALVAVPGANGELIRAALGGQSARVRFADMADVGRNPGRIIPGLLHPFIAEHTGRPVRIIGEPVWAGRSSAEYAVCLQHEAMVNVALAGTEARLLCPYDVAQLKPDAVEDAHRTHPVVVRGSDRRPSDDYRDPIGVAGTANVPFTEPIHPARSLTFHADGLGAVRRLVAEEAVLGGLFPDRIDDLQLAVNEVATNAVTHSPGPGRLRVWREADRVICEIGSPSTMSDPLAGRLPPEAESERGRGLVLVHALCDLVQTYAGPGRTVLRLHVCR